MEVDGHPLPDRQPAGGAAHAMAEVTAINGERDARLRLSRPQRYDGRGDAQVLDEFVAPVCGPIYTSTLRVKSGLMLSRR